MPNADPRVEHLPDRRIAIPTGERQYHIGLGPGELAEYILLHGDPDRTKHWNWFGIHYGKDLAGGGFGDGQNIDPKTGETVAGAEEPMSAAIVFMFLNFVLLMALLVWKGKPAAQKLAAERHDQIKTALDEAAKLRKQAQDKLSEYETKLKDADAEIKKLVDGIRTDAEADKARILANAANQSAHAARQLESRLKAIGPLG